MESRGTGVIIMKLTQEFKVGDVVYLHPPINPIQDKYVFESFYDLIGLIIEKMPTYSRVQTKENGYASLYHSGEMTKIGEL